MSHAIDVILLKEIGLSTIARDGEPLHLLHVRNLKDETATFAFGQEHLTALIERARHCVEKGLELQFNNGD